MTVFTHLMNFRDFEGYRKNDGTLMRGNVFARCNNPLLLDEDELKELKDRGFGCVIDLRRDRETEVRPDYFKSVSWLEHHHIIMNDEVYLKFGKLREPEDIAKAFYSKLTVSAPRIAAIFNIIAEAKSGVIFHCESGKDRTGTIAALLLLLLDISDEDIVEDYRLSYDRMYLGGDELVLGDPDLIPMAESMERFLSMFRRDYDSADQYFISIGLSPEALEQIRSKAMTGF